MFGRRDWTRTAMAALPGLWLALFVLAPLAVLTRISFSESASAQPPYRPVLPSSLEPERWREFFSGLGLGSYRTLLSDPLYRDAILSSIALAGLATAIVAPIGYGVALALARASPRWRPTLIALVVLPFWTSFLVRVYAWIAILKTDGWLNQALLAVGLIRTPLLILNTDAAVLVGLVSAYLPFMILPVYAALDRQDPALIEAAADLGASPLRRFWTVTFPLAWPGLAAGSLLCFIPMVGEYVIPDLLGGADTLMLGRALWIEFSANRDWPLAAAVAIVLLAILLVPIIILREIEARRLEGAR